MKVRLQREKDDLQRRMEAPDTVEWCLAKYHRLKAYFDALCIVEVDLFAPLAGIHARPVYLFIGQPCFMDIVRST